VLDELVVRPYAEIRNRGFHVYIYGLGSTSSRVKSGISEEHIYGLGVSLNPIYPIPYNIGYIYIYISLKKTFSERRCVLQQNKKERKPEGTKCHAKPG
jgi:hypothetical protein